MRFIAVLRDYRQLRHSGATRSEAWALLKTAKHIQTTLRSPRFDAKDRIALELGISRKPWLLQTRHLTTVAASFIVMATIVASQFTQSNPVLHQVKRGTDAIRSRIQPGFNEVEKAPVVEPADDNSVESGDDNSHGSDHSGSHNSAEDSQSDDNVDRSNGSESEVGEDSERQNSESSGGHGSSGRDKPEDD